MKHSADPEKPRKTLACLKSQIKNQTLPNPSEPNRPSIIFSLPNAGQIGKQTVSILLVRWQISVFTPSLHDSIPPRLHPSTTSTTPPLPRLHHFHDSTTSTTPPCLRHLVPHLLSH